jgi:MFS family permease
MASNAGIIIGPMLGGMLADHSFFWIFALDALSMLIFAGVIFFSVGESKPPQRAVHTSPSHFTDVLHDPHFVRFSILWGFTGLIYSQLFMVLPAYLHINLGYAPSVFGTWLQKTRSLSSCCKSPLPASRVMPPASPLWLGVCCSMLWDFG